MLVDKPDEGKEEKMVRLAVEREAGPMKFIICRSSSGMGDNGARVALGLASFLFKF